MSRQRARAALVLSLAAALALPGGVLARDPERGARPASAIDGRIAALQRLAGAEPDSLIVRYRDGSSAAERAQVRAAERLDHLAAIPALRADVVQARGRSLAATIAALRRRPEVVSVDLNHRRAPAVDPRTEPGWSRQWGHHNVGQSINGFPGVTDMDVDGLESLLLTSGSPSVVVAVIDDGVDFEHPDLQGSAWTNPGESGFDEFGANKASNGIDDDGNGYVDDVHGWDFCQNDNTVHDVGDDFHGTAVAGSIAAQVNGLGVAGIAPGTRIMALKFISGASPNRACNTDAAAIQAIEYAKRFGVRIMNASWGGPGYSAALEAAVAGSGALFVAAAGNAGANIDVQPTYPAAFSAPNILTVGAIHNEGGLAAFSNYGRSRVHVVAPGEDIWLPFPAGDSVYKSWAWISGTSFSAPYVAGVAALVGSVRSDLLASPTALRSRVLNSGVPLAAASGKTTSGRLVNARTALDFTRPVLTGTVGVLPLPGAAIGTSSVKIRLSWPVATDDLGMGSYRVEQQRNAGDWTVLAASTTARTLDPVLALSGTYQFRVTPRDAVGNWGAPLLSRVVAPSRYEEGTSLARYGGTWATASSTASSGGKTRYTTASGASVTLTFNGRTAALVAPMGPSRSSFKVYLDGVYIKTVSLYASTTRHRVVVYTTGTLASTTHTLKLVHTRVGSRIRADVDAFVVLR